MNFLLSYESVIVLALIHAILGLSMWLVMSQNVISLAGAGFMACGAYASAILFTRLGWPLFATMGIGILVAVSVAYMVGRPIVGLHTHYLAIASLGFTLVVKVIAVNWRSLTNGTAGIFGISRSTTLPITILIFAVIAVVLSRVARSHIGRSMYAVGDDEIMARAFGISVSGYRLWGFVASAALASAAGSLLAHRLRIVDPTQYGDLLAFMMLAYAILGGIRHWSGPAFGALFFIVAPETVRFLDQYREVMTGLILLLVMIYLPGGLVQPPRIRRLREQVTKLLKWKSSAKRSRPNGAPTTTGAPSTTADPSPPAVAGASGWPPSDGDVPGGGSAGDPGNGSTVIGLEGVSVRFGAIRALQGVTAQLDTSGGVKAIIGPNGSGKSTLLNVIGGQLAPDAGAVWLNESEITRSPTEQRALAGLVRTFQSPRVPPEMTVLDGLLVATSRLRKSPLVAQALGTRSARAEDKAYRDATNALLNQFGLVEKSSLLGRELSFGQKRLVELIRCVLAAPSVALLDEPTSGVNPQWFDDIRTLIRALEANGALVILVEHNMEFVESLCDDIIVLDAGQVIARDSLPRLRLNNEVMEAYLGVRA